MQQAFTQLTGLRSKVSHGRLTPTAVYNNYHAFQTIDTKFDEIEGKVLSLETALRTLLKDISSWIEELQVCVYTLVYLVSNL